MAEDVITIDIEGETLTVDIPKALEEVNKIRMALAIGEGKIEALPKGKPERPDQCVLARALSNGWEAAVYPLEAVYLTNNDESYDVDFDKCAESLKQLGFKSVYFWLNSRQVEFAPTSAMNALAIAFDKKLLPDLILED